jgi:hypothetical protein
MIVFYITINWKLHPDKNFRAMKNRIILTALFAIIMSVSNAQNNQVLYFMNLPQNHFLNPALTPVSPIYVGLPGLTGININITNNFFNFSDLFSEGVEVSKETFAFLDPDFNRDKFLDKIKDLNYFEPKASVQLLGFGMTMDNGLYVFLDVVDNFQANIVFPRDLVRLAFLGNEDFAGQTFNLSDTKFDFQYYREIGIGVSKNITPKFRFGAKARLLFGIAGATFQNYAMNLTINEDYSNTLEANTALDISGPVKFTDSDSDGTIDDVEFLDSELGKSIFGFKNPGFGLDLGAEYSLTDRIILSASLTDVGYIRWKSDLTNLEAVSNINFRGLDFNDIYEGRATIDDVFGNMKDSLKNVVKFADLEKRFVTKIPFGLTIGGKYILNDRFSFGILSYSRINGQQLKEALTLSAHMNINNVLTSSLAYTVCNHNYSNLGLGIGVRASVAQFYFMVDRIPISWERAGDTNDSFALPKNWNTIHTRFGINLVFGNKKSNQY